MIIAVEFDGTIVEDAYPQIGREVPFAIATLKRLQAERNILILWTSREGTLLDEAVEYCRGRGLEFYAVNINHPEEEHEEPFRCRKLRADMFIDSRNVGGMHDWGSIYEMASRRISYRRYYREVNGVEVKKPSLMKRIFGGK